MTKLIVVFAATLSATTLPAAEVANDALDFDGGNGRVQAGLGALSAVRNNKNSALNQVS